MEKMQSILKELRTTNKLTQAQIAKEIGVTQKTYSNYEIGARLPDITTLIKIADIYKVSLDYITGRYK